MSGRGNSGPMISAATASTPLLPTASVLSAIPDAAILTDHLGRILAHNSRAKEYFGAVTGVSLSSILRSPAFLKALETARQTSAAAETEVHIAVPIERHLRVTVTPVIGSANGSPDHLLVVAADETEARRLAEMRADFVANASHELRTPLASLRGFVETLQGAARSDPVAREKFLSIMSDEAQRMTRLIDDLLSLSRIEMSEHLTPRGQVDLVEVAMSTRHALEPLASRNGQTIVLDVPSGEVVVPGDRDELAQVAYNLVQNGLKYGKSGGRVTITVSDDDRNARFAVEDDGIGIAREHIPRLTERFFRVSAKDSRARGGTGLGLAIVKHILRRHGGSLEVESELGKGSRFVVTLRKNKI